MSNDKSQKKLSPYLRQMAIREGLSFSDYMDDSVPADVKPVYSLTPMEEDTSSGNLYDGWLDKDGNFISTKGESHLSCAKDYLKSKNINYSKFGEYGEMYKLGFVRVKPNWFGKKLSFEYYGNTPTNSQIRFLKNYCIEKGWRLMDDSKHEYVDLNESINEDDFPTQAKDLFKGIWEDILQKNVQYWLDPQGRFNKAGNGGHQEWAMAYLDKHKIPYDWTDPYRNEPNSEGLMGLYHALYGKKFMRIAIDSRGIYATNDLDSPNNMQMRNLKDSAIESDLPLWVNGKRVDLMEGNPTDLSEVVVDSDNNTIKPRSCYWLDPFGKFNKTVHHHTWAYKHLGDIDDSVDVYDAMYKAGFVRVVTYSDVMFFEYKEGHKPTNLQMRSLRDAAIEFGFTLYDSTSLIYVDLMESKYVDKGKRQLFIESMNPDNIDEFKSHLAKLFAYLQKELQLKTIPKVKLISDDKNADKILGKTAYYNPDAKEIVLYITSRHQKDILRSFAHEVIHHWQHENEKLQAGESGTKRGEGASDPQYAQKNPWLRQMEKQAYLLGNMLFRDWEDQKKASDKKSCKSGDDNKRKSNKGVVEKTSLIGVDYPPRR